MEKNQFLSGFAAFGGGRYQCPGRYSAHSVGVASWLILWVWLLGLFCGCGFLYVSSVSPPLLFQVVCTNGDSAVYSRCVAYV